MNKNKTNIRKIILAVCSSAVLSCSVSVFAATGFIVKNIKVVGLKRVSSGTVLNYLPFQVGEDLSSSSTAGIIKALYDTGFFQSVSLERQDNTLVIHVVERATIGEINIVGNKELPSDSLKAFLKQMGLVKGRIFQASTLESLEKELRQAYSARGKYNARVESRITELTENRVAITITISEGRVSRIREIRIIGNQAFSDAELQKELSLSTSGIYTYFSKKDQYTQANMDASLEALRSWYYDRGYLKFNIISSQVMLAPDKKDVYINIHIEEGPQYRFAGYDLRGKLVLPREEIDKLIPLQKGMVFSRKTINDSVSAMSLLLGKKGYGFPVINAEPGLDETNKTVFVHFFIEPGRHVYVRRINFHGNTRTADYVLRNMIRQNEGALLSLQNIKESERQLRVLGYLKDVNIKTTPVPGANNQVDLDVNVEESGAAEFSASLGYGSNGPQVSAKINHRNFMGTGRIAGFNVNGSLMGQDYSFNYYNPFYAPGMGRGLNIYYKVANPKNLDISSYISDMLGGDISYNMLLSEVSALQFGFGYQNIYIRSSGNVSQILNFINTYGNRFNEFRLVAGWNRNTYNQMPFPSRGSNQQFNATLALPLGKGSLSYYKAVYTGKLYQPLIHGLLFSLTGNLGYGNGFGGDSLPFFENFYAGGIAQPGMVRGYETYSLGPKDSSGFNALGGNFLFSASAGLILPYPFSRDSFRTSGFVDVGNVFAKGIPLNLAGIGGGGLRYSAGLAVDWRSPMGPLTFSLAKALNPQPGDNLNYFQFSVSSAM